VGVPPASAAIESVDVSPERKLYISIVGCSPRVSPGRISGWSRRKGVRLVLGGGSVGGVSSVGRMLLAPRRRDRQRRVAARGGVVGVASAVAAA
jgi:hypothetical protein